MSRTLGQLTERVAAVFLRLRGLRIVYRNYTCPREKIDLVALQQKKNQTPTLVFVEVRYRSSEQYGSAAASIDETKQLRLIRSAEYFLNAFKEYANLPMRFDAVLLTRSVHQLPITWIKDAFNA